MFYIFKALDKFKLFLLSDVKIKVIVSGYLLNTSFKIAGLNAQPYILH